MTGTVWAMLIPFAVNQFCYDICRGAVSVFYGQIAIRHSAELFVYGI